MLKLLRTRELRGTTLVNLESIKGSLEDCFFRQKGTGEEVDYVNMVSDLQEALPAGCDFPSISFPNLHPFDCIDDSGSVLSTIAVAISMNGERFASTHGDHTVKVFDFKTGKLIRVFVGHPRTPWTVKFHPIDPNIVASGCLGFEVRVWNITKGICLNVFRYDQSIISLAFHPSGQFILVASGPALHTWEWKEGCAIAHGGFPVGKSIYPSKRRVVHPRNIRAVSVHPSGEFVFAAAPDHPRGDPTHFTPCRLYAFKFSLIMDASSNQSHSDIIDLGNLPSLIPQVHLYSDGGFDVSADGNYLLTCAMLCLPPVSLTLPKRTYSPISHIEEASTSISTRVGMEFVDENINHLRSTSSMSLRPRKFPSLTTNPIGECKHDEENFGIGEDGATDSTMRLKRVGSKEGNASKNRRVCKSSGIIGGSRDDSFDADACIDLDEDVEEEISIPHRFPDPRDSSNPVPLGWRSVGHICLLKLDLTSSAPNGGLLPPTLMRCRPLSNTLIKGVTSCKLSPTSRYALIGYGVRNQGKVEDHPTHDLVSCEAMDVTHPDMVSVNVISDHEDEVNIAQFHPVAGLGLLYGTKKGRVRVFKRP